MLVVSGGRSTEHGEGSIPKPDRDQGGRKRDAGGAGLGLNVSRMIVAAHRGRIDLNSEPDRGTTVTVTLPASADVPTGDWK